MILIYTPQLSSRIAYTFNLVFTEVLGIDYKVISDAGTFTANNGVRLNYSRYEFEHVININPSGILTQTGVLNWNILPGKWEELPVIFANNLQQIPFDLFSAVFYIVTRYEEYLPHSPDQYGRFKAEDSLSYKYGFLRIPIVDLWCKKFAKKNSIISQCKNIQVDNYRFRLTIDIDQPWLFKNKGLIYAAGSLIRELIHLNFAQFADRFKVLAGLWHDPSDTYEILSNIQTKLHSPVHYFILCQRSGEYDKNRSVGRKAFHNLIRMLDRLETVGIHPSYLSNESEYELKREIDYLTGIVARRINNSRQHFLRIELPDIYRSLIKYGISEDYSMSYSSQTGFRAGIARAFNFFDLINDEETKLRVVPFQIMDRTLLSYMQLSTEEAIKEFEYYSEVIRNVGGEFICLWHNESINDRGEWKGWAKVFFQMIEMNSIV